MNYLKSAETHLPLISSIFHITSSVRSYAIPGKKLSSIFSVELFNILAPSKSVSHTYNGPYKKLCKK